MSVIYMTAVHIIAVYLTAVYMTAVYVAVQCLDYTRQDVLHFNIQNNSK